METSIIKEVENLSKPLAFWGMICLGLFLLSPVSKTAYADADPFGEYLENHPRYEDYFRSLNDEQQDRIERQYLNQLNYRRPQPDPSGGHWRKQPPPQYRWQQHRPAPRYGWYNQPRQQHGGWYRKPAAPAARRHAWHQHNPKYNHR